MNTTNCDLNLYRYVIPVGGTGNRLVLLCTIQHRQTTLQGIDEAPLPYAFIDHFYTQPCVLQSAIGSELRLPWQWIYTQQCPRRPGNQLL